jgi:pyruvate dehydrogenase E1 component beta subunit
VSVEVVDLRSIRPLDFDTVAASVAKTHRVLIVEEQRPFCSVGSQLGYMIQRECFDDLDAPIHRVSTIDAPAIYSPPVEVEQLPNPARILKAALEVLA